MYSVFGNFESPHVEDLKVEFFHILVCYSACLTACSVCFALHDLVHIFNGEQFWDLSCYCCVQTKFMGPEKGPFHAKVVIYKNKHYL